MLLCSNMLMYNYIITHFMASSDKSKRFRQKGKLTRKEIFWIIVLIVLGIVVLYGLVKQSQDDEKFKKHLENEQNHKL